MYDDVSTVELFALAPEAASAPVARRAAIDAVRRAGYPDRCDDAALAVSELVTNAVLHGKEPIVLRVIVGPAGVRIEIEDGSPVSPAFSMLDPTAITGRGLVLVAAVADAWGVEPIDDGKVVWFGINRAAADLSDAEETERLLASWADGMEIDPALEDVRVVLTDVDVALLAASETHNQDLLRELAILASSGSTRAANVLSGAASLDALRAEVRQQVALALHRGLTLLDVHLVVRREDAAQVRDFLHAIDEADRMSRAGELLVMPSDSGIRDFRQAFLRRLLDQLRS
jgi:anti-sigma regulatory factor (Ser/Thr protein kinase)